MTWRSISHQQDTNSFICRRCTPSSLSSFLLLFCFGRSHCIFTGPAMWLSCKLTSLLVTSWLHVGVHPSVEEWYWTEPHVSRLAASSGQSQCDSEVVVEGGVAQQTDLFRFENIVEFREKCLFDVLLRVRWEEWKERVKSGLGHIHTKHWSKSDFTTGIYSTHWRGGVRFMNCFKIFGNNTYH